MRTQRILLLSSLIWNTTLYAQTIVFHYNERPPYIISTKSQTIKGLVGTPASIAVKKSGISYKFIKTPSKRQMIILKKNKGLDCLVGWYRNPTRKKKFHYTKSIYQAQPQIGLALKNNKKVPTGQTIESVFKDKSLKLLVKSGYSYGVTLDEKIKTLKPDRYQVTTENINMLSMISLGRADYMFIEQEEVDGLIQAAGHNRNDYKLIRFSNMESGLKRHILCSKNVPASIIERLNMYILNP